MKYSSMKLVQLLCALSIPFQATLLVVDGSIHDKNEFVYHSQNAQLGKVVDNTNLNFDVQIIEGSFGYEEYEWPCRSDMTAAYGYALGQCSRSSTTGSYIYNWCAISQDESKIYFHVTEYRGTNCTDVEFYNHTFWDDNTCDAVNSRRPFCKASKEGWKDYDFDQHIEVHNDPSCQGDVNYWKADNLDCLDFCQVSPLRESIWGQCDKHPNDWSDNYCFHIDSTIEYKGVEYSYEQLSMGEEPECTVPHSPRALGVVIATSCHLTARVTDTHLMATPQGFRPAFSLKPGDVLFAGYGDEAECVVLSVQREMTEQQYFGLNCMHSEVLASGLRASTFGDFHELPSWFMTYVSGLVGPNFASLLGSHITKWWY